MAISHHKSTNIHPCEKSDSDRCEPDLLLVEGGDIGVKWADLDSDDVGRQGLGVELSIQPQYRLDLKRNRKEYIFCQKQLYYLAWH